MLRSAGKIINYHLLAKDGAIGRCKDFLFDDRHWTIRYMVADTGKWLPGRKVLVSIMALEEPDWATQRFPVRCTREQIETGPSLDENAPVSRQYERKYLDYYQWPYYWIGDGVWGPLVYPYFPASSEPEQEIEAGEQDADQEKSHLRSISEVTGYHIEAEDGDVGHVEDFIIDDEIWTIRYMIVDTRNWLPGRKIIVSPGWIDSISWAENKVHVNLTVDAIENGPEFDPSQPVNREYEAVLYDFYGRPRYWEE